MKNKFGYTTGFLALIALMFSSVAGAVSSFDVEVPVLHTEVIYTKVKELRPVEHCERVQVRTKRDTSSSTPELLGALIGGAIGKSIDDKDSSSDEGAVIGALLGASIASDMEADKARAQGSVRTEVQCSTVYDEVEVRKASGWDVTYRVGGHLFTSSVDSQPGNTITVRVFAVPVDAL